MLGGLAEAAGAATTLGVTTPADGRYIAGTSTPLLITISSDRAVEGVLVATASGQVLGQLAVEVPGGSAKEFVMVVMMPRWGDQVVMTFQAEDDDDDQSLRTQLFSVPGDELVGVFPDLSSRNLPETAPLSVDLGVARFFALEPSLLDVGTAAFATFDYVLATASDLESLDSERLATLESWIGTSGGILLVDEAPGTVLPLDYDAHSGLDSSTEHSLGLGSVIFTGDDARSGNFDGLVGPTALRNGDDLPFGGSFGDFPTSAILARDAGLRVPSIKAILIMLGLYAVVVGPVLWIILRRTGRETSLWIAVPAVALLATAGVYVVGTRQRLGVATAHATVVADFPTSRLVTTEVLVSSPNGGWEGVELGAEWTQRPANLQDSWAWEQSGGRISLPQAQRRGSDLLIDLPPGGTGTVRAEATQTVASPNWEIDLTPEGVTLVGTVTNRSGHDMAESFVAIGQGIQRLGAVADGESRDIRITPGSGLNFEGDVIAEQLFRQDPWSNSDGETNPGVLLEFLNQHPNVREPGVALAVGWSADLDAPVRSSRGSEISVGRTALISVERIQTDANEPSAIQVDVIRGTSTRVLDPVAAGECAEIPLTMRFRPASVPEDTEPLLLAFSRRTISAMDVWDGEQWVPGQLAAAGDGDQLIALSRAAYTDGAAYARFHLSCEFWGRGDFISLRPMTAQDDAVTLSDLAEDAGI